MSFNVILATDQKCGIGKNQELPWKCSEDLMFFKSITKNQILIVGRVTWNSMPQKKILQDRHVIVVSKTILPVSKNYNLHIEPSFNDALIYAKLFNYKGKKEIFVIGGVRLYHEALNHAELGRVYHTLIYGIYDCDVFVPSIQEISKSWKIKACVEYDKCVITEYLKKNNY